LNSSSSQTVCRQTHSPPANEPRRNANEREMTDENNLTGWTGDPNRADNELEGQHIRKQSKSLTSSWIIQAETSIMNVFWGIGDPSPLLTN
jgi:hypothetical protein